MASTVVGLDIGAAGVKAAWVKRDTHGGFEVVGTAYEALPKGWVDAGAVMEGDGFDNADFVSDAIKHLWSKHSIPSKIVAIAISDPRSVFVTQATVPWTPPQHFEQAMHAQIRHHKNGGVDPDDADLDTLVLGEITVDEVRKLRVLVCSAISARTERLTDIVAEAGLAVHSVHVAGIANLRGLPLTPLHDASLADLIVDVGASQVSVLIHQGGVPLHVAIRPKIGGDWASEAVLTDLSMDSDSRAEAAKKTAVPGSSTADALYAPAQQIAKFVRDSIEEFAQISADNHFTELEGVGSVTMVGGGSRLFGLPEAVKRAISEDIDLYPGPWLTETPADDSPDFTLAVGLAVIALPALPAKAVKAVKAVKAGKAAATPKPPKLSKKQQAENDAHTERADPLDLMFQRAER